MSGDPKQAEVKQGQKELQQRMIVIARWLKHRYNYKGSKETMDFVARGFEKLICSETCADKVNNSPNELLQLSGRLMRQVVCDELRSKQAQCRTTTRNKTSLNEHLIGSDPSVERRIDDARRFGLVQCVLAQIESGKIPFRFSKRARMLEAFRLKFRGLSENAIAAELGVSKGTAHNWVKHVTVFLTRQVAKRELDKE
jgi:Homeodomain-like domain-containing protein